MVIPCPFMFKGIYQVPSDLHLLALAGVLGATGVVLTQHVDLHIRATPPCLQVYFFL